MKRSISPLDHIRLITQLLPGNILRFNYDNINLPDSNTNEPASHGYAQFKIKRKQGLPVGTTISNTAYIYFDYNEPVVTNTVSATLTIPSGLKEVQPESLSIFPNPAKEFFTVSGSSVFNTIEVYNLMGEKVLEKNFSAGTKSARINTAKYSKGVYFVKAVSDKGISIKRIVVE